MQDAPADIIAKLDELERLQTRKLVSKGLLPTYAAITAQRYCGPFLEKCGKAGQTIGHRHSMCPKWRCKKADPKPTRSLPEAGRKVDRSPWRLIKEEKNPLLIASGNKESQIEDLRFKTAL